MRAAIVTFIFLFLSASGAEVVLKKATIYDISKIAPRLSFLDETGVESTCTGFFVNPYGRSQSKKRNSSSFFVTAAHCHLDSELNPMHKKFTFEKDNRSLSLSGSMANACHDLIGKRVNSLEIGRTRVHHVARNLPKPGEKLMTFGYPVQVVGNKPNVGIKMDCSYEGVTQSESSSAWQANLFQHQMVCNFPYVQGDPAFHLGGISGGPVFNRRGQVVGVVSQQRVHCPSYAKDECSKARLLFTEVHKGLFDKKGRMTTQRSKSRYTYARYLPWAGRSAVPSVDVDFDHYGCIQGLVRSTKSPSFHGRPEKIDFGKLVPRL